MQTHVTPEQRQAAKREIVQQVEQGASAGSGSLEQDGPLSIVAVQKEEQARFVHDQRLGKGQRHAHKTGQTLT